MAGTFVVSKPAQNIYRFSLYQEDGELIAYSGDYTTLEGCRKGLESVRKNSKTEHVEDHTGRKQLQVNPKYEIDLREQTAYEYILRARNGEIIIHGGPFTDKESLFHSIDMLRETAPDAVMDESSIQE